MSDTATTVPAPATHTGHTRRQHTAAALWPWSLESSRPTRKTFTLPLTRPLNL